MTENTVTGRDNPLWLQFWRDQRTDFHQDTVNPLLIRFWPALNLRAASRIFVPLCGKSLDLIWLAQQGHTVIGVELSPVATRAFFRDNHLHPHKRRVGNFTLWQHDRISILCGDYFALHAMDIGAIDVVYDRAALTALPIDIRELYAAHLQQIVSDTTNIFLLTIEDEADNVSSERTSGVNEEITALYSNGFEIELAYTEAVFEPHSEALNETPRRAEYKVYFLSGRSIQST